MIYIYIYKSYDMAALVTFICDYNFDCIVHRNIEMLHYLDLCFIFALHVFYRGVGDIFRVMKTTAVGETRFFLDGGPQETVLYTVGDYYDVDVPSGNQQVILVVIIQNI